MHRKTLLTALMLALAGCGGGSDGGNGGGGYNNEPPAAAITASGAGALVLHPSLNTTYTFALETPIRVQETAGGDAVWNFARFSVYAGGREIERGEIGSDVIRSLGYASIGPRSNAVYTVVFRFNSEDFEDLRVTLGFTDARDGRQFTVDVPEDGFTDVTLSLTPMKVPAGTVIRMP